MVTVLVTNHAIQRYAERIGGDEDSAFAVLSGETVQLAAQFGARVVRIPHGRVLMKFSKGPNCTVLAVVVTVLPIKETPPRILRPQHWGGPPPSRDELPHLQREA